MEENKVSNFLFDIIEKDLADGVYDEVHTRFPPEPNGYLHIGHIKAIYINYTAKKQYNGKFNLRYDDTNPTKEDVEFVDSIYEDLKWLIGEDPDGVFYGSAKRSCATFPQTNGMKNIAERLPNPARKVLTGTEALRKTSIFSKE